MTGFVRNLFNFKVLLLYLVVLFLGLLTSVKSQQDFLLVGYSSSGGIWKYYPVQKSWTQLPINSSKDVFELAYDPVTDKVFWFDSWFFQLLAANASTGYTCMVTSLFASGVGLDMDPVGRNLYYTSSNSGEITRLNVDTGAVTTVYSGLIWPQGLALSLTSGYMYFTDAGTSQYMVEAKMDGSSQRPFFPNATITNIRSLALLDGNTTIYSCEVIAWPTSGYYEVSNTTGSFLDRTSKPNSEWLAITLNQTHMFVADIINGLLEAPLGDPCGTSAVPGQAAGRVSALHYHSATLMTQLNVLAPAPSVPSPPPSTPAPVCTYPPTATPPTSTPTVTTTPTPGTTASLVTPGVAMQLNPCPPPTTAAPVTTAGPSSPAPSAPGSGSSDSGGSFLSNNPWIWAVMVLLVVALAVVIAVVVVKKIKGKPQIRPSSAGDKPAREQRKRRDVNNWLDEQPSRPKPTEDILASNQNMISSLPPVTTSLPREGFGGRLRLPPISDH